MAKISLADTSGLKHTLLIKGTKQMPAIKIKWSELLHITDLEFVPDEPKVLVLTDELVQSISWLTGATGHDRKLLRCNEVGAILVGNSWDNLTEVDFDEIHPQDGTPDSYTAINGGALIVNKGVLVSTSTQIIQVDFVRVESGPSESIYIPAETFYFFPHPIYSVTATVVPASGGTASYVGITLYN